MPRITPPMVTLVLSCLLAQAPLAHSQNPAPQGAHSSDRFGETTDVVLVQIPVHVSRDGVPVRGLTAKNFEVLEGRKKQEVVAVDVYDLGTSAESLGDRVATAPHPPVAIPAAGRRNFMMMFDLSNSQPASILRARTAAMDLADRSLDPSDLVAVATYTHSRGVELLMGFSTDRAQLRAALDNLGLVNPFERISDPLRLRLAEVEAGRFGGGGGPGGNKGNALTGALISQLRDQSEMNTRNTRDQIKQQILDLSTNLDQLARLLDSASGRKQVILFSQGFDSEIVFGTRDTQRIEELIDRVHYGEYWLVNSEERFGASDAQNSLLQMLEHFNRSDCAVHSVDIGGLAAGGDAATLRVGSQEFGGNGRVDRGHDGLHLMASETGGEFYRNLNDLTVAMDDLMERTSVTYVVSIRPRKLLLDGAYHPLKVRLRGVEKGVELSHRPGYYARRPYSQLAPEERHLVTAEQLVTGTPGGLLGTELLAAAFPGQVASSGKAHVVTAIEIDGPSLLADVSDNTVPTEIHTYAFDERGQILDLFNQSVVLDLYKVGYRLQKGIKLLGHLELPPGRYEVRSLVRNVRSGASGLAVSALVVPDFSQHQPVLLPPLFIEPDDQWLVLFGQREDQQASYPLVGRGKPMVPASRPHMVTGHDIPMLLVGFELPESFETEARLIDPSGADAGRARVEIDRRQAGRDGREQVMTRLATEDVKPGDYRLVVTVRGEGREVSSSLPVRFLPGR